MSQIQSNKKTNKKTKISLTRLFLLLIILLVLGRIVYGLTFRHPKTEIVKYGNIELSQHTKGYLIKDETVIQSPTTGQLQKLIDEGQKVKKGINVASIIKSDSVNSYAIEVNKIDNEINDIQKNIDKNNLFENDITKIDANIKNKLDEVTKISKSGEINKLNKIKSEINDLLNKKSVITGKKGFVTNNIEQKNAVKETYTSYINSSKVDVPASIAGILSYNIDGCEMILSSQNVDSLTVQNLESVDKVVLENKKNNQIVAGQPLFKLIDNFEWYVACVLKKSEIEPLEVNNTVLLELDKIEKVPARVHSINMNETKDRAVIVFSITNSLEQFYNNRKMDIKIIKRNYEGIKIPLSSIIRKDQNTTGVLLVNNGITKFKEVDIIGFDNEYAIVVSENELSTKKGLSLYNEIIINPSRIKEGVLLK